MILICNNYMFVSYPRSGHHALLRIMGEVSNLSDGLYCENYNCQDENQQPIECNGVKSAKDGTSCLAGRPITKSHDFDLTLAIQPAIRYVIQVRDPMLSIPSWYRLNSRKSKNFNVSKQQFWNLKIRFWIDFVNKWAVPELSNVIIIKYDEIGHFETIIQNEMVDVKEILFI
jgi:hypothetical protein